MDIRKLIDTNGFITVNKEIIRCLGLEEAVLLGELSEKYNYCEARNLLDEEGFIFVTAEDIEHEYIWTDLYIMVTDKTHEEIYMYTLNCIKEEK